MINDSDLQKWQKTILAIETEPKDLLPEELSSFYTLKELFNAENFDSSESAGNIKTIKDAMLKHSTNRLLKMHLTNLVELCEKYFKSKKEPVITRSLVSQKTDINNNTTTSEISGSKNDIKTEKSKKQKAPIRDYFYIDGNQQKGPVDISELKTLNLKPDTYIWSEGFDDWKKLNAVKELKTLVKKEKKPAKKSSKKRKILIGIIAGIVLLCIAAVVCIFIFPDSVNTIFKVQKTEPFSLIVDDQSIATSATFKDDEVYLEDFGNKQNPLYGKTYKRTFTEISELKNWKDGGGMCVADCKFAIAFASDENKNAVFIFEEILHVDNIRGKILDTLNIGEISDEESYCVDCYEESKGEQEDIIIAIVINQIGMDNPYYETIVKAWRLNMKMGKFEPIDNYNEIKCRIIAI